MSDNATFDLPEFPWDRLAPLGDKARAHPGGIVDLSIGTPVDSVPEVIQSALAAASDSPGYPPTAGIPALQKAMRDWSVKYLGTSESVGVLPSIGSKEMATLLPFLLRAKRVLYPDIAYPSYHVGAVLAGAEAIPVGEDPKSWPAADFAWINSPSNPTGALMSDQAVHDAIRWAISNDAYLVSDECYLELGWEATPRSVLSFPEAADAKVIAMHSLSKRSNLAGYRAGFAVGNPSVISELLEIRKHIGMMMPGPVQLAMIAALADTEHVTKQRAVYLRRRTELHRGLTAAGFTIHDSVAGLYLWATRDEECWKSADWLAQRGILVAPGDFYGVRGKNFVRAALTATDERIDAAVARLTATA